MKDISKNVTKVYDSIADDYTRRWFDVTKEDLPFYEKFIELLPTEGKVLDLGAGPGGSAKYLIDRGFSVDGVDVSPRMVEIASEKVPGGLFQVMDMRKLQFDDESYDGMVSNTSLIHVPTDEVLTVLSEWRRVLKTGGYLLILLQEGEPDQLVEEPLSPGSQVFLNKFTLDRLRPFVEQAGFEIVLAERPEAINVDGSSVTGVCVIARK